MSSNNEQSLDGSVVVSAFSDHRPTLLDRMLEETTRLAEDTRDLVTNAGRRQAALHHGPAARLLETVEIGRVTSRVGMITAWILARKAVLAGELDAQEALDPQWRLGGQDLTSAPLASAPLEGVELEADVLALAERSLRLYERVERLDAELDVAG